MSAFRVVLLALGLTAAVARAAEPQNALTTGKQLYRALEFERCLKTLEDGERTLTAAQDLVERELYLGLCEAALSHTRQASRHFQTALELDPTITLPPGSSPKVESLFALAKARVPAPPPATPPPALVPTAPPVVAAAPPPTAVEAAPPPPSPRVAAWIPWTLGGLAVAGAGAFTGFGLGARSTAATANARSTFADDSAQLGSMARTFATVANVALATACVALAGLVVSLAVDSLGHAP